MMWRNGEILTLGKRWNGCVEVQVRLDSGQEHRSLVYTRLVGEPVVGARVVLCASAAARGLGTGGYLYVVAMPDHLPHDGDPEPGHIVKARYTPLQYMTLGVDEQESPWHETLRTADSVDGMPVVVADLHSALPAVACAIRAKNHTAKVAYIMDDGASLPAWFSQAAAALKDSGHICGTITCGQAFGGDLEAVNIHTALLAARLVWGADIAVVAQGPGNLGTGTSWGFSGTRVGDIVNAVNTLGGRAIGLLRMSNADQRGRHLGLSHHTTTALTRVALTPALCPVPVFDDRELSACVGKETRAVVEGQLAELFACERLQRADVSVEGLEDAFASSPVGMRTMGRGLREDALAFLAAGVAGYAAADMLEQGL